MEMRSMKIVSLDRYRGRNPKGYFQDLPWEVRNRAYQWLYRLCSKWDRDLPAWRFAILVGQAKRPALKPPNSAWGRSMHAKRGGLAVQRKYRLEGRHLTEKPTRVRLVKQQQRKQAVPVAETRPNRILHLPLWD
jgi:hypothetical protein